MQREKVKDMRDLSSVIVVTYNALPMLKNCLGRVHRYTAAHFELIVVDNGSQDGTGEWLKKYKTKSGSCQRKKILINTENKGWPYAVNQGIRASNGRFIALLNADIYVTKDWLPRLIAHLLADPKAGLIAPMGYRIQLDQDYERWYGTPEYKSKTPESA